jgi:hypothetical protein
MGDPVRAKVTAMLNGPDIPKGAVPPCRGHTDLFFPPNGHRGDCRTAEGRHEAEVRLAAAKALCGRCAWLTVCGEYADAVREPWGVWGGRDEVERGVKSRSRDRRRQAAKDAS